MPYYFDTHKIKLPKGTDRRVKITPEMKESVFDLYKMGYSQRAIARELKIDRVSVKYLLFPEKLKHAKELYKERRKDGRYYNKEKHTIAVREYKRRKQKILTANPLYLLTR